MRIALVALGLGLAACQPAPVMLGEVDLGKPMRALGTEPFWGIEITPQEIVFTDVDRADFRAANPGPRVAGAGAVISARDAGGTEITITLKPDKCSDGMSDWVYPLSAEVKFGGETLKGCAASQTMLDERPKP
jgi:uncharacterized membrane protein